MNPKVKLLLYVVFAAGVAFFGYKALSVRDNSTGSTPPAPPMAATNSVDSTNPINAAAAINLAGSTNVVADTNLAALTNQAAAINAPAVHDEELTVRRASTRVSHLMAYAAAALLSLVGLAILISQDASRFVANRFNEFIFNDNLEGMRAPEYEEAEEVWKQGDHLEAIRLMREYLKQHPREQYVALRIAEIYESDLRNYVAAALEYEEILKKRLPSERWGWAAIHLANLYSGRLNKPAEAEALLRRIIKEYGQTAAAKKARERLGIPEPSLAATAAAPTLRPQTASEPSELSDSNLPPGFRPKK